MEISMVPGTGSKTKVVCPGDIVGWPAGYILSPENRILDHFFGGGTIAGGGVRQWRSKLTAIGEDAKCLKRANKKDYGRS
jgi:hypothetical protein